MNRWTTTENFLVDLVDWAVMRVKFKLMEEDPRGSSKVFVISVIAKLYKDNAFSVVKEAEQYRQLILKLMRKVEPPTVPNLVFKEKNAME